MEWVPEIQLRYIKMACDEQIHLVFSSNHWFRRTSATCVGKTTPVAKLTRSSVSLNGFTIVPDVKQETSFFTSSSSLLTH